MFFEQHKRLSWQLFLVLCILVVYLNGASLADCVRMVFWLVAFMIGSFIPDIDHPYSIPRKRAFPLVFMTKILRVLMDWFVYKPTRWWIKATAMRRDAREVKKLRNTTVYSFRHRRIIHNPLTAIVVFGLALVITHDEMTGLFAALGFLSHLVGDSLYSYLGVGKKRSNSRRRRRWRKPSGKRARNYSWRMYVINYFFFTSFFVFLNFA